LPDVEHQSSGVKNDLRVKLPLLLFGAMRIPAVTAVLFFAPICWAQTATLTPANPAPTASPTPVASPTPAGSTSKWEREDKSDPLRGTSYSQYSLTGKFLTPPHTSNGEPPVFIVKCIPTNHRRSGGGYVNGKLMDAYIVMRSVVDHSSSKVFVQYRLDDSKMHKEWWGVGTDGTAIFPPEIELNTVLYGHFLPHKEGTNDPIRKLVLGVDEYLGAEVVIQFDFPDPTEMTDACGLLIHKK
jgi:hypothetical protein